VVKTNDKDTHPAASTATKTSAQAVVSPPGGGGNKSESQPAQEQPHRNSFFDTGFGQLIGIVGAVLLGVLIHLIALVLIMRRYSTYLARVSRVELVNPAAVGFVGQESAPGAQTVAAAPATSEMIPSSTAETFDIGPTFAEELQQKQEALSQQEEAILRHIFELNMRMRDQLGQLSDGAA
jgi:predicted lipid-binding transport protein (Tim44 family)